MSQYDKIFTDVVKDVIGNDPVLDQFDISYEASFYGGMQDDYITGSILSAQKILSNGNLSKYTFVTGSRGRRLSKYFAENAPPLDSTYNSEEVLKNPSLAYRTVPWHERASSTAYRITQAYDASERYYDSCIPDVSTCFKKVGSEIFAADVMLSPYGNVEGDTFNSLSSKIGYMIFNSYAVDRSSLGYETDPTVNNEWTWSYPFESKYSDARRIISTDGSFGLSKVSLKGTFGAIQSDILGDLFVTNLTRSSKEILTKGFLPVLPGKLSVESLPPGARNAFRPKYIPPASQLELLSILGQTTSSIIPASYSAELLDGTYGFSYLIPSDVNLSKKDPHSWLGTYYPNVTNPGPEYVTGTLSTDDSIRFLFGFGDLNNMTYGYRLFDSTLRTTPYTETFSRANPSDSAKYKASDLSVYSDSLLTVDWTRSPSSNAWRMVYRDGATVDGIHNYISSSAPASYVAATKGMFWEKSSPSNDWILVSDTSINSTLGDPGYSLCCVDITSSFPWSLKYMRGIVGDSSDFFLSYFSGIPGYPSHELPLGPLQVVLPIDVITGSGPTTKKTIMTQYDLSIDGVLDADLSNRVNGAACYPLPPGEWRLNFSYTHNGGATGDPDITAIDTLEIVTFGDGCFPPDVNGQKLGCNNYPEFRTKRCDGRFNPILPGTNFMVTSSANFYKSFVFGVSPVIRGWKYGLYSGLPMNSKSIFRRERFGQFRDMLEQRQYTKFINVNSSPVDDDAVVENSYNKQVASSLKSSPASEVGPSVAEVKFVRQRYSRDERGIGRVYSESVDPLLTVSQNLSTEVTSSVPYADGTARHRQESDFSPFVNSTLTSLSIGPSGLTVK